MAQKIKHDLNRSGWETSDMPSVCENCLPDNPYVQMLKEDHGAECKICSRPYTVFRWKADRTSRQKRTNICLTCARLKNCCQCCMLDLSFGLSIPVRDAALKMIAPGPQSDINKQWYAQEHEKAIEEGKGAVEGYSKTDEKARDLLRRLARSEPYRRRDTDSNDNQSQRSTTAFGSAGSHTPGPIRTRDSRRPTGKGARPTPQPPGPEDILPPADPNIASLFVTGVEDDLPEHEIRTFFSQYGTLRSLVVSHRAHCGYVNYQTRQAAELAADACQGKAVIAGCPLRVRWGKPKKLDSMDTEERMQYLKEGRSAHAVPRESRKAIGSAAGPASNAAPNAASKEDLAKMLTQAPLGTENIEYASLGGD